MLPRIAKNYNEQDSVFLRLNFSWGLSIMHYFRNKSSEIVKRWGPLALTFDVRDLRFLQIDYDEKSVMTSFQ